MTRVPAHGSRVGARVRALLALAVLVLGRAVLAQDGALEVEVFVAEPEEINVTSALVMGPTEMLVVSAQGTKSAAERLAERIESTGRELRYVFLTHPHLDHSQGASVLLDRFPSARFIAAPEVARLQRIRMAADDALAVSRYGDNAAVPSVPAHPWPAPTIEIDGHTVEILSGLTGDAGLGYEDEPHTALHVPSARALIPSDIVYFDGHVMMGGSTSESRQAWISQLEAWKTWGLETVVPGHMPRSSLAALSADGALDQTIEYIRTYDDVIAEHDTADAVIAAMLDRFPGREHTSALRLGTYLNFSEVHRLLFNPTLERVAAALPAGVVRSVNEAAFASRRRAAHDDANDPFQPGPLLQSARAQSSALKALALWAGLHLVLTLALALNVTRNRLKGDEVDAVVLDKAIRAHGNNIEYVPALLLALTLLALLEVGAGWIHLLGAGLLLARLLHAHGITRLDRALPRSRVVGNLLTWAIQLAVAAMLMAQAF